MLLAAPGGNGRARPHPNRPTLLPDAPRAAARACTTTVRKPTVNDVYNIEERAIEPVGGAARFTHAVSSFADEDPLILFSGDCLNRELPATRCALLCAALRCATALLLLAG